jgi:hypothetical protein
LNKHSLKIAIGATHYKYQHQSAKMSSTVQSIDLIALMQDDPVSKFLINGGSWADAIEMELLLTDIPVLEARIIAACKKQNPSAERYRAKLLGELRSAYYYVGKGSQAADDFLAEALTAKAVPKKAVATKTVSNAAPVAKKSTQNTWDLLAIDSDDE